MSQAAEPKANSTSRGGWSAALLGTVGRVVVLFVVIMLFGLADWYFADNTFLSKETMRSTVIQTCIIAIAALGMTMIIIAGGIDLSAGMALALCATTLAWGLHQDIGMWLTEGTTFRRTTEQLNQAHTELTALKREQSGVEGDQSDKANALREELAPIINYWEDEDEQLRERLIQILEAKKTRASNIGDEEQETEAKIARIADKIENLWDDDFRPKHDGSAWEQGVPNEAITPFLAVGIGLLTGILAGLINGVLISKLKLVPFVVTLGTMTIFLGIGNLLSNNTTIRPAGEDQVPPWIGHLVTSLDEGQWFGLFPTGVFLMLAAAIVLAVVLHYTVFGRYVFALGSNESTARLCGVNVPLTKIAIYTIAGLFVGIAGICQFAKVSNGAPESGRGLELEIIAAVVIGGGSLNGGRGSVVGTLVGAAVMTVINNGCRHLEVSTAIHAIIVGLVIIAAVWVDQIRQQRMSPD